MNLPTQIRHQKAEGGMMKFSKEEKGESFHTWFKREMLKTHILVDSIVKEEKPKKESQNER